MILLASLLYPDVLCEFSSTRVADEEKPFDRTSAVQFTYRWMLMSKGEKACHMFTCSFLHCLCPSGRGSGHLDLTELIGVPLPPSVSFTPGYEGQPAYNFGPNANIGRLTKTFVPGSFYRDFAIIATVKFESP